MIIVDRTGAAQGLTLADDLLICDGVNYYRVIDLDIGAAYRPQITWANLRAGNNVAEVQIHGLAEVND